MALWLSSRDVRMVASVAGALQDIEAQDWLVTCEDLATDVLRLFRADFIGTTHCSGSGPVDRAMCVGREDSMTADYLSEFQYCDPLSPLVRLYGGPALVSDVMDPDELRRSRYYNEFLRRYRTVDGARLHVMSRGTEIGDLRVWRAPGAQPLGSRELDLMRLLEPALAGLFRRLSGPRATPPGFDDLTSREREVALLIADGSDDLAVAAALAVSVPAVRTHVHRICAKLGLPDRAALAAAFGHSTALGRATALGQPTALGHRPPVRRSGPSSRLCPNNRGPHSGGRWR